MLSARTERNNERQMRYNPSILNLRTKRWVISFTPRPLYLRGKCPPYSSNRTHCGPQGRSACFGYTEIRFALPGTESYFGLPGRTQINILSYLEIQYIKTGCHKNNKSILLHSKTPSDVSSGLKLVYNISCKDYRITVPWNREWWFTTPKEESPVRYVIHQ